MSEIVKILRRLNNIKKIKYRRQQNETTAPIVLKLIPSEFLKVGVCWLHKIWLCRHVMGYGERPGKHTFF